MMIRPVSEADFSASGELRIKCVVTLADKYREPSHVVTVHRQDGVEETPVVVTGVSVVNAVDVPEAADRSSLAGRFCSSSSAPAITNRTIHESRWRAATSLHSPDVVSFGCRCCRLPQLGRHDAGHLMCGFGAAAGRTSLDRYA